MVIDVITFNGEVELFDIRYSILKDYIDEFRVIEFDQTFSGKPKKSSFKQKYDKVKHYFIKEKQYNKYLELAKSNPATVGADHWKTEFCQKESIKDCLTDLKDTDTVFIGDCDEIYQEEALNIGMGKLKLRVYTYYLNNRSSEIFAGTIVAPYKIIKEHCLNDLRNHFPQTQLLGWHFTSLRHGLKKKLEDSYTKETYANDWVMENLEKNIDNNWDFLGRGFNYWVDEKDWPQYLKDNKKKYRHLIK